MRCPKCHYLSFDPEPRCRNCGYGLSSADADLVISPVEPVGPPTADLEIRPGPEPTPISQLLADLPAPGPFSGEPSAFDPKAETVAPPLPPRRPLSARAAVAPPTTELPLFVRDLPGAAAAPAATVLPEPVSPASVPAGPEEPGPAGRAAGEPAPSPRPPQAGHRQTPDRQPPRRSAPSRRIGPLDRDLLEDLQRIEKTERREAARGERAGTAVRLAAAAIDGLVLSTLALAVLWVTLRWCDLSLADAAMLPPAPTASFLLLVGFGYLLMFTAAGGQTLGKMAMGLRVVGQTAGSEGAEAPTLGQAALRACVTLPSVLALGVGFLPTLVGDERALHDRASHTRVVRA